MEIKPIDNTDNFKIGGDITFKINIDNSKGKLKPTECKIVLERTVFLKQDYLKLKIL